MICMCVMVVPAGILESNSFCCYGHYEDSRLLNAISGQKFDFFGPSNAEVRDRARSGRRHVM